MIRKHQHLYGETFMKKLILAMAISLTSFSANAIFLQQCFNHVSGNQAVSYSYQSCINRNFREIERNIETPVFLQHCSNYGTRVDYFFTSCINRNFKEIEREINEPIFLNFCTNFTPDRLDFSYTSCVNRNYRALERVLRK